MDLTILIKTFERPDRVSNLVSSIKKYYPDLPIIVVDDSKEPHPIDGVEYIKTDFDIGVSAGRNLGLKHVKTKYFFTCDDDNVFLETTDLRKAYDIIVEHDLDLLGVEEVNCSYYGSFMFDGETAKLLPYGEKVNDELTLYDFVPNLFIAKTESILNHPWDETLKIGEHFAFFFTYRGELKIGYTNVCSLGHAPSTNTMYAQYRHRSLDYVKDFMRKTGIKRRVDLLGSVIEI